ncbi:hypothetical protein EVA_22438 [gut metagenome]|uniref:Uncharacterized protein n=1 Tax=gut metagenome TaxID=749906 RepID=J9FPY9_9ZZZZ
MWTVHVVNSACFPALSVLRYPWRLGPFISLVVVALF